MPKEEGPVQNSWEIGDLTDLTINKWGCFMDFSFIHGTSMELNEILWNFMSLNKIWVAKQSGIFPP